MSDRNTPSRRVETSKIPTADTQMSLKEPSEDEEFLDRAERIIEEDREILDALAE